MKAYIIKSDKKIEPFNDHPCDCLIGNRRLEDIQKDVLKDLNLEFETVLDATQVEDNDEYIIFEDCLLFSKESLLEFINLSRKSRAPSTCALKRGLFTLRSIVPTQDVTIHSDHIEYKLKYLPAKESRDREPIPAVIDPDQFSETLPLPEHMYRGHENRIPITDIYLIQIDHWANIWAANISVLLAELAHLMKAPKRKFLIPILKAHSLNKWKVLHQINQIGKNCDIHPTSYIEGSTIGDNVMIGAGSVIRLSHIGSGTNIGSNSTVECSVIGDNCAIDSNSATCCAVLYPGAATSNRQILASLCGRGTFIADGVFLADYRFDRKSVSVIKDGQLVDTGSIGLGSCLGHDVYLGAGCLVAPGRMIPNGLRLIPEKTRVIESIDPNGYIPGYRQIEADGTS